MRAEATKHDRPGRKIPGCPATVCAAVGTIWGESKLGGRNIKKYLQPRNTALREIVIRGKKRGKPTHSFLGDVSGASSVNTGVHYSPTRTRTLGCGCIGHPAFPAPSGFKARDFWRSSGAWCRENANVCVGVFPSSFVTLAPRMTPFAMDCVAGARNDVVAVLRTASLRKPRGLIGPA